MKEVNEQWRAAWWDTWDDAWYAACDAWGAYDDAWGAYDDAWDDAYWPSRDAAVKHTKRLR